MPDVARPTQSTTILPSVAARRRRAEELLGRASDLRRLAIAFPGMRIAGLDPLVENLERACGLGNTGLTILRVRLHQTEFTVIAVGRKTWRRPEDKERLHLLKRAAEHAGRRILLVPPTPITRQPRLDNSRWIASCSGIRVTSTERSTVITHLYSAPRASLVEVASRLRRGDAAAAILSLVAAGDIELDFNQPITPTTVVKLARRRDPARSGNAISQT
jgi:hypothetical protein